MRNADLAVFVIDFDEAVTRRNTQTDSNRATDTHNDTAGMYWNVLTYS